MVVNSEAIQDCPFRTDSPLPIDEVERPPRPRLCHLSLSRLRSSDCGLVWYWPSHPPHSDCTSRMPRRSRKSASLWKCDEFWRRALAPRSSTHNVGFLCSHRFSMRMKLSTASFPFLRSNPAGVVWLAWIQTRHCVEFV